ncbi:hypothetical protein [Dysgonomonas sp. 511]|uniref:hypothetical protein n=1 Tax=Dysgonomonas sp. 511 TaxID=2302930 RepID=UPI0013D754D5|nr:hypothetical protein [Dysgonomonas sp. 511]NDV79767.1 hypothetical protein [Dysgonomonas sp. 511]
MLTITTNTKSISFEKDGQTYQRAYNSIEYNIAGDTAVFLQGSSKSVLFSEKIGNISVNTQPVNAGNVNEILSEALFV